MSRSMIGAGAFALSLSVFAAAPANADAPAVVASIKPLHGLVSAVMDGVGKPTLLVPADASPHGYALKPSQAQALQSATAVFWIGEELERFLTGPLDALSSDAKTVALMDAPGLTIKPYREGGAFPAHDHGDHDDDGHHDHDKHGHDDHDHHDHDHGKHAHDDHDHHDHDHGKHAHDDHDHHDHGRHAHGEFDPHIWLDPENAQKMLGPIADTLAQIDPANADAYRANAKAYSDRLGALTADIAETVQPVKDRPFLVLHDAYQYFEARFGVTAIGSVRVNPETPPSAARMVEIKERAKDANAPCIFAEPQFSGRVVKSLASETGLGTAVLDPLGAGVAEGPDAYATILTDLASAITGCLAS